MFAVDLAAQIAPRAAKLNLSERTAETRTILRNVGDVLRGLLKRKNVSLHSERRAPDRAAVTMDASQVTHTCHTLRRMSNAVCSIMQA